MTPPFMPEQYQAALDRAERSEAIAEKALALADRALRMLAVRTAAAQPEHLNLTPLPPEGSAPLPFTAAQETRLASIIGDAAVNYAADQRRRDFKSGW